MRDLLSLFPIVTLFTCISLFVHAQSSLWGMNTLGGRDDKGTLGYYDPATSSWPPELSFTNEASGAAPWSELVELNGKFYGVTSSGGISNAGVIFEWGPSTNSLDSPLHIRAAIPQLQPSLKIWSPSSGRDQVRSPPAKREKKTIVRLRTSSRCLPLRTRL